METERLQLNISSATHYTYDFKQIKKPSSYILIRMAKKASKQKPLTIPNIGKDTEQLELGMQNGMATLENSLAVSYKIKQHSLCIPLLFAQEI